MLRKISLHEKISVGELGDLMLMDQSTVTRNLNILKKLGYATVTPTSLDARKKSISITHSGKTKLAEAIPLWEEAQAKIEQELGLGFEEFLKTLHVINELVKRP